MIFSELYGSYYHTVAKVLGEAIEHPISNHELHRIIEKHAFGESVLTIPEALKEERWPLLRKDGTTPIRHKPTMPISMLQKRWLKAIATDPRVKLFGDAEFDFDDVEPLFHPEDVIVFDKYADSDDYSNEQYIQNFRLILDAIRNKYPLHIEMVNRKGRTVGWTMMPEYLEYSEKDDKFRLIGAGKKLGSTVNLGRITKCRRYEKPFEISQGKRTPAQPRSVCFEVTDERNALERVLMHFAHFEKTAERISDGKYKVEVHYDKEDETEMVIRMLSFGPMVRVTAPQHFIELIKQRLIDQKSCEQ